MCVGARWGCCAGSTNLSFTEDVLKRYEAYGWHTQTVSDGNAAAGGLAAAAGLTAPAGAQRPHRPSPSRTAARRHAAGGGGGVTEALRLGLGPQG